MPILSLFGGTFNPIHNGHLDAARQALQATGGEKILFMPAALPPHKSPSYLPSIPHRSAMLDLALDGHQELQWTDIELKRPGRSYTIDTVRQIQTENPDHEIVFLTGTDALEYLHMWKDISQLLEECTLSLLTRPGYALAIPDILQSTLPEHQIKALLENAITIATQDISSTMIRARLRHGESIEGLVPEAVATYIKQNHLYE